jgi:hypothetical protein
MRKPANWRIRDRRTFLAVPAAADLQASLIEARRKALGCGWCQARVTDGLSSKTVLALNVVDRGANICAPFGLELMSPTIANHRQPQ